MDALFYTRYFDFGWTRTQLSWRFAPGRGFRSGTGSLVGSLMERFDVWKVMFTGVPMVALSDLL